MLRPTKIKDGAGLNDATMELSLEVVNLGMTDEDREPVTSCVMRGKDADARQTAKLEPHETAILVALDKTRSGLTVQELKKVVTEHDPSLKDSTARMRVKRGVEKLEQKGLLRVIGGLHYSVQLKADDNIVFE